MRPARICDGLASVFGLLGLATMAFVDTRLGAGLFVAALGLLAVRPVAGLIGRKRRADDIQPHDYGC